MRVRIGVTGHRGMADPEAVAFGARARLTELRAVLPSTEVTRVSFGVLSSLAEGGDRLVVSEALAVLADAGVRLHAVLPMSPSSYIEDFDTDDSRGAFEQLLEIAAVTTELDDVGDRDEAYERAGRYVVDNCDVLLALWDGRASGGQGGTQEVVEYAQQERVPVLVVPTRRSSGPPAAPAAHDSLVDGALVRPSTLEAYRRLEEFNRAQRDEPALADAELSLRGATEDPEIRAHSERVGEWALPRLARADALAMRYQKTYYRLASALYLLAALAVAVVAAQSQAKLSSKLALAEVACMLAVLAIYAIARRVGLRDRWLGYRSLAEALRSSLFIALTNVGTEDIRSPGGDVAALHEHWFQRAFSAAWEARPATECDELDPGRLRAFLIKGWLAPQIEYHEDKAERLQRKRILLTRVTIGLFAVTIVAGLLHAFEVLSGSFWPPALLFLALALPGLGAALSGVRDLRQYRIHEHRFERTARRLRRLRDQTDSGERASSAQRLAAQIQTAIDAESADWSGVVEFQDLEVVV